eukprot:1840134-Rhodomonas_salina.1
MISFSHHALSLFPPLSLCHSHTPLFSFSFSTIHPGTDVQSFSLLGADTESFGDSENFLGGADEVLEPEGGRPKSVSKVTDRAAAAKGAAEKGRGGAK